MGHTGSQAADSGDIRQSRLPRSSRTSGFPAGPGGVTRLQGVAYSDLHDIERARATVNEVPTPELIGRVEALAAEEASAADAFRTLWNTRAGGELIGQAEAPLRDSACRCQWISA